VFDSRSAALGRAVDIRLSWSTEKARGLSTFAPIAGPRIARGSRILLPFRFGGGPHEWRVSAMIREIVALPTFWIG
jgi:hypothetical protein